MKTTEFIEKIKDMGFLIDNDKKSRIIIQGGERANDRIALIYSESLFKIDTVYGCIENLEKNKKEKLVALIVEYIGTPVEEREEEKKYYLKHRWINDDDTNYLNLIISDGTFEIYTKKEIDDFKTKFTQTEIDWIKGVYNTVLEDFEIIEVEE